jgi:predicted deacylase
MPSVKGARFKLCGKAIARGTSETVETAVSELYDGTPLLFRVTVARGRSPGPTLFVMAALHGDEVVGVEVVRRLTGAIDCSRLSGDLLLVPVANPFGLLAKSRYMPDRGDLNRSFPGRRRGSATARMAHFLMREIVSRSDYGIELHTAASRRRNIPQVRADLERPGLRELAEAFGCPYVIHSRPPAGSIRGSADPERTAVILYEAGEILRVDEEYVREGYEGCLGVMRELGMLPRDEAAPRARPVVLRQTSWVRSERGGLLTDRVALGQRVNRGEPLAAVALPHNGARHEVVAPHEGTVIGLATSPLVNPGDAVCHLAW